MSRESRVESRERWSEWVCSPLSTLHSPLARLSTRRAFLAACAGALLAGCGFRLRGEVALPFDALYISVAGESPFAAELSRQIQGGSRVKVVNRPEDAQAVLHIVSVSQEKQILTLTRAGTVAEFLLRLRVNFRLQDRGQRELIPLSEIVVVRDYSFNSSQVLAKDKEESLLYRDMQTDAVQQLLRRLQTAKL
jgi:LPS-assembly lipoprotein